MAGRAPCRHPAVPRLIALRSATPDDRDFIVSSWEMSYRKANTAGLILMEDWAAIMRPQVAKILDRDYVKTTVAYESEDRGFLYGYLVSEPEASPPLVYWAYVKQPYRRQGVATVLLKAVGLLPSDRFDYVCSTPIVPRLSHRLPLAKWKPLLGRYSREHRDRL